MWEYFLKQIEAGNPHPIVIPLNRMEVLVGRKTVLSLSHYPKVSKTHASIHRIRGVHYIRDIGRFNNLYVNFTRVGKDMRRLELGDIISFGTASYEANGGFVCVFTAHERIKTEETSDEDDLMIIPPVVEIKEEPELEIMDEPKRDEIEIQSKDELELKPELKSRLGNILQHRSKLCTSADDFHFDNCGTKSLKVKERDNIKPLQITKVESENNSLNTPKSSGSILNTSINTQLKWNDIGGCETFENKIKNNEESVLTFTNGIEKNNLSSVVDSVSSADFTNILEALKNIPEFLNVNLSGSTLMPFVEDESNAVGTCIGLEEKKWIDEKPLSSGRNLTIKEISPIKENIEHTSGRENFKVSENLCGSLQSNHESNSAENLRSVVPCSTNQNDNLTFSSALKLGNCTSDKFSCASLLNQYPSEENNESKNTVSISPHSIAIPSEERCPENLFPTFSEYLGIENQAITPPSANFTSKHKERLKNFTYDSHCNFEPAYPRSSMVSNPSSQAVDSSDRKTVLSVSPSTPNDASLLSPITPQLGSGCSRLSKAPENFNYDSNPLITKNQHNPTEMTEVHIVSKISPLPSKPSNNFNNFTKDGKGIDFKDMISVLKDCHVALERCDSQYFNLPPDVKWSKEISLTDNQLETDNSRSKFEAIAKQNPFELKNCHSDLQFEVVNLYTAKKHKVRGFIKTDNLNCESEKLGTTYSYENIKTSTEQAAQKTEKLKFNVKIGRENEENNTFGETGRTSCKKINHLKSEKTVMTSVFNDLQFHISSSQDISMSQNHLQSKLDSTLGINSIAKNITPKLDTQASSYMAKTINISHNESNSSSHSLKNKLSKTHKPVLPYSLTHDNREDDHDDDSTRELSSHCNSSKLKKRKRNSFNKLPISKKSKSDNPKEKSISKSKSKHVGKTLLTEPLPMKKRPKYYRGREEWFEEQGTETSTSLASKQNSNSPLNNQEQTLIRDRNHSDRIVVTKTDEKTNEEFLKTFKIPKLNKINSENSSKLKKKTSSVPRRSDNYNSRMGFLTEIDIRAKPGSRAKKNSSAGKQKLNSGEKKSKILPDVSKNKCDSQYGLPSRISKRKNNSSVIINTSSENKYHSNNATKNLHPNQREKSDIKSKKREQRLVGKTYAAAKPLDYKDGNPKKNIAVVEPYRVQSEKAKAKDDCKIHSSSYFPFLKMLLKWNPKWLTEQKESSKPPPLVPVKPFAPTSFENYESYSSFLQSLITYDVWDLIYRESKHLFRSLRMSYNSFYCIFKSYTEKHGLIEVQCEAAVGDGVSYVPSIGDVILINMQNRDCDTEHLIFAFITVCKPVTSREMSSSNWKTVSENCLAQSKCYIFTAYIKRRKIPLTTSLLLSNGVGNIQNKLHLIDNIHKFQFSTLSKIILKPHNFTLDAKLQAVTKTKEKFIEMMLTEVTENTESHLFLWQGLPGTGKTTAVIELLEKLLYFSGAKIKVIICAVSDSAVDEIGIRLLEMIERCSWREKIIRITRIGNSNKIHYKMQTYKLKAKAEIMFQNRKRKEEAIGYSMKTLEKNIEALVIENCDISADERSSKLKSLMHQYKECKEQTRRTMDPNKNWNTKVLDDSDVVLSTISDFKEYLVNSTSATPAICIIEETCLCSEPELLQCLPCCVNNLVLIGDSAKDLKAQKSITPQKYRSMFDRLYATYKRIPGCPLFIFQEQHRMHSEIFRFPSAYFYKNKISCPIETDTRCHLFPLKPYVVLDIAKDVQESQGLKDLFSTICCALVEIVPFASIGAIVQGHDVDWCRKVLSHNPSCNGIEVNSIDEYLGKEKDVMFMTVRNMSSPQETGDMIIKEETLSLSLTRARKTLIVCGNITSLTRCVHWKSLLEDAKVRGVYTQVPSLTNIPLVLKTFVSFLFKPPFICY